MASLKDFFSRSGLQKEEERIEEDLAKILEEVEEDMSKVKAELEMKGYSTE